MTTQVFYDFTTDKARVFPLPNSKNKQICNINYCSYNTTLFTTLSIMIIFIVAILILKIFNHDPSKLP